MTRYLQAARYAFSMPRVIRGRDARYPRGPIATRVFAVQKRSTRGQDLNGFRKVESHRTHLCPLLQLGRAQKTPWTPDSGLWHSGECSPKPSTGFARSIVCALVLKPVIANSTRRASRPRRVILDCVCCSLASVYCYAISGCGSIGIIWPARDAVGVN